MRSHAHHYGGMYREGNNDAGIEYQRGYEDDRISRSSNAATSKVKEFYEQLQTVGKANADDR